MSIMIWLRGTSASWHTSKSINLIVQRIRLRAWCRRQLIGSESGEFLHFSELRWFVPCRFMLWKMVIFSLSVLLSSSSVKKWLPTKHYKWVEWCTGTPLAQWQPSCLANCKELVIFLITAIWAIRMHFFVMSYNKIDRAIASIWTFCHTSIKYLK